jgi:hypothetical protein
MLKRSIVVILLSGVLAAGCYHATVETGLTPSTVVIEESFASCWIYGLVPPSPIAAQAKCTNGVAKVETEHSFVNQLVGFITLGIYTPMSIKVTCAAGGTALLGGHTPDIVLEEGAGTEELQAAFVRAADLAVERGTPVFLKY